MRRVIQGFVLIVAGKMAFSLTAGGCLSAFHFPRCICNHFARRACRQDSIERLRYWVRRGADVWHRDGQGRTLLHEATERGDLGVFKFLVVSCGGCETLCNEPNLGEGLLYRVRARHDAQMEAYLLSCMRLRESESACSSELESEGSSGLLAMPSDGDSSSVQPASSSGRLDEDMAVEILGEVRRLSFNAPVEQWLDASKVARCGVRLSE